MTDKKYVISKDPSAKLSKFMDRGDEVRYCVTSRNGSFKSFGDTWQEAWKHSREQWWEDMLIDDVVKLVKL